MGKLKVYQIGLGSFGRHGFEKLVDMHNHLEEADIELKGVCEKDFDKLEAAEKFAEAHGIQLETFKTPEEMYESASREDGEVMVYGAGPADVHSHHIHMSLQNGFYHLTEKPPSMTREEYLKERKLSQRKDVFYKVDFVERENPVVKKTVELLEGEEIDLVKMFRESSVGAQKVLQPVERLGVKGGDILDKMIHEIYLLDFLETAGINPELELEDTEVEYFMPKKQGSEKMMSVDGGVAENINVRTATGRTRASFTAGDADLELHSSWLGLSREAEETAHRIEEATGSNFLDSEYRAVSGKAFTDEEARFFTVEGSRNLAGDMLHRKLYDLETGEEIDTPDLMHDQLYRVIEKAVLSFTGRSTEDVYSDELDTFVNAVFDVREKAVENSGEFMDELDRANQRLKEMIVEDMVVEEKAEA